MKDIKWDKLLSIPVERRREIYKFIIFLISKDCLKDNVNTADLYHEYFDVYIKKDRGI